MPGLMWIIFKVIILVLFIYLKTIGICLIFKYRGLKQTNRKIIETIKNYGNQSFDEQSADFRITFLRFQDLCKLNLSWQNSRVNNL